MGEVTESSGVRGCYNQNILYEKTIYLKKELKIKIKVLDDLLSLKSVYENVPNEFISPLLCLDSLFLL